MKVKILKATRPDGSETTLIIDPREEDENGNIKPLTQDEWETKYGERLG